LGLCGKKWTLGSLPVGQNATARMCRPPNVPLPEMRNPRTPGTGITGAWNSLGGENSNFCVAHTGLPFKDLKRCAAELDREADQQLAEGRHGFAETLARRAAELREGGR
jgi:hypothetical protein